MNDAFREQLLKAGLATKKQAKAVTHEENVGRRKRRKKNKGGAASETEVSADQQAAQAAAEEKRLRDKALNEEREETRKAEAVRSEVDDLVTKNRLKDTKGEIAYQFVDDKKVKRVFVTEAVRKELAEGDIGIVDLKGAYVLVSRDIALKVEDRCPERLVWLNEPEETDEDDPYGDYKVPDDLVW